MITVGGCYLIGGGLGVLMFLYLLRRDGFYDTVLYWNNPTDFSSPYAYVGSCYELQDLRAKRPPLSIFAIVWGMFYGSFVSVLAGVLFGGFLIVGIALFTGQLQQ